MTNWTDYWASAWRNWVRTKYRKASEIDFTHHGCCKTLKVSTSNGDIFCVVDRSPRKIKLMRDLIVDLYQKSNEPAPIFVPFKVFRRIEIIEHG